MNSSIWFNTQSLGWFIEDIKGQVLEVQNEGVLQSLKIVFVIANSAGPDEMLH